MEKENFDVWALVELMGHQKIVGRCTEKNIAGTNFLQVDVPTTTRNPPFTRLIGGAAIYAINPITEELAKVMADKMSVQPIQAWDVREHVNMIKALPEAKTDLMQPEFEKEEEDEEGQ